LIDEGFVEVNRERRAHFVPFENRGCLDPVIA